MSIEEEQLLREWEDLAMSLNDEAKEYHDLCQQLLEAGQWVAENYVHLLPEDYRALTRRSNDLEFDANICRIKLNTARKALARLERAAHGSDADWFKAMSELRESLQ